MSGGKATTTVILSFALAAADGVPEWVMLLPAGASVATHDERGPYVVGDRAQLIAASLQGGRIPLDENHSTDLAAPSGAPSPARGWIVEIQERPEGGLFGRVEWTAAGKALMADRAYRFISPVVAIGKKDNRVQRILRASLTNTPNLRDMVALNAEGADMNELLAQLRTILGLKDDADQAAVIAKVKSLCSGAAANAVLAPIAKAAGAKDDADAATVLQAVTTLAGAAKTVLAPIAKAAGLKDDADATAVLNAVTALAKGAPDAVVALQGELTRVTTQLNTLQTEITTERATAFVDGAIKSGRVGVKPLRGHYIARHATDPAGVEKEINAMPILGPSGALQTPPVRTENGEVQLNAEQENAARLLGIDPKAYAKTLAGEQAAVAAA